MNFLMKHIQRIFHLFDKDLIIPKTVKAKDLAENTKYDREANIIFNRITVMHYLIFLKMKKKTLYEKMKIL